MSQAERIGLILAGGYLRRQVVLRGPTRSVLLQIAPDVPLDKIAVGDSVHAKYRAETAVLITRDGKPIR